MNFIVADNKSSHSSMRWGLVPSHYQGELKDFKLPTHNCRGETIPERPMFQKPFKRGFRGVIPANGFFEWSSTKGTEKIPHYVHAKTNIKEENTQFKSEDGISFKEIVEDNPLLMIAALYDIRKLQSGETFYSVSVVTVDASESLNWLHHRMPALLETPEEVQQWLHTGSMISHTLLPLLHPRTSVSLYPVSKAVNSVKTQGELCVEEMAPVIKKPVATLDKFFNSPTSTTDTTFSAVTAASPRSSQKRKAGTLDTFFKKRKLSDDS